MKINLSRIKDQETFFCSSDDRWVKELSQEIKKSDSFELLKPFKLTLTIKKPADGENIYLVEESIDALMKTYCSRCLDDFKYSFKEKMVFTAINSEKPLKSDDELSDDPSESYAYMNENDTGDDSTIYIPNNILNVSALVLETIFLNLPYAPVCNENCRGLCTSCGVNLNHEQCKCSNSLKNNKFEKLRSLSPNGG